MKNFPSLTNYIEAITTLDGRTRTLPCLVPILDSSGMPIYRNKGGMVYFPVLDSDGVGFALGLFLNRAVREKFSARPNQRLITEELYVHSFSQADYVDVVLSSDNHDDVFSFLPSGSVSSNAREISEGFRAFKDDVTSLWGFCDASDKESIKAQWSCVEDFAEGRATVQLGDLYGLIDTQGELIVPIEMDELSWDGSQYVYCERNGLWGVIDRNGNKILDLQWEWIGEFSNNYIIIQHNQLFGYANQNGQVVIEPKYNDAGSFNQFGAAWVRIDDNEFFIDPQQRRV